MNDLIRVHLDAVLASSAQGQWMHKIIQTMKANPSKPDTKCVHKVSQFFGLSPRAVAVAGLGAAILMTEVVTQQAKAAAVRASDVAASDALGDVPGNLWVTATANINGINTPYNFTAFTIGQEVDQAGNTIRTFLYAPAHGLALGVGVTGQINQIGDGNNFLTNLGRILQNVQVVASGNFDPVQEWQQDNDWMILSTTTAFSNVCFLPLAPANATASIIGQELTASGFSRLRIDGVVQPANGNSYGFNGQLNTVLASNLNGDGSYKALFFSLSQGVPVAGMSQVGGSGSRVTDLNRTQVYGAVVAGRTLDNYQSGQTYFADFTTPGEYRNAVTPYWGTQIVQGPLVINASTNFGFANGQFRFTLTGPAGSNAVISASTNLQTWTPLLTNTLTGGALNFTDTLATNYPRRFYRANLQ